MKTVTLDDVAVWGSGGTPKRSNSEYFGEDVPWLSIADLNDGVVNDAKESLTYEGLANSSAKLVPAGTIFVAMYGSIGKLAVAGREMATSQAIAFAKPRHEIVEPRFLFHYLKAQRSRLQARGRGGTQMNIGQADLRAWTMPLPKLEEQRRIAAILDQADILRTKRREAFAHLNDLTQSIFHEMFGVENYPIDRLDDIADVVSGITKGRKVPPGAALSEVPYVAVSNVQDMSLNMEHVKTIAVTEAEIARYQLQIDDLLMTEGGDPDKLGRGTLWTGEVDPCLHQNHIYRVRVKPGASVLPVYLNWTTSSGAARDYFLRCAKQTTGIASINKTQLSATPVPVPPIEIQSTFADRIAAVERLKTKHRGQLAELDALFASLQDRAFAGRL